MKYGKVIFFFVLITCVAGLFGCGAISGKDNDKKDVTNIFETELASIEETTLKQHIWSFTIAVAGDINFDEDWYTMEYYSQQENGIYDCIDETLLNIMNDADVMWINNEFTYSDSETALEDKYYTFESDPSNVEILEQMGVDIVSLANNHACDYGTESLLDTIDTLNSVGIDYVGAGSNIEEASEPVYYEIDGKTVAFVAASCAEKNVLTPEAGEDSAGIMYCYDTTLFIEEIQEAAENSDYVIAYVHWGTEYSNYYSSAQQEAAYDFLDAGADVIVGAHAHCMQGIEYYNGKPIIYGIGNFWFNEKTLYTTILELNFSGEGDEDQIEVQLIPALQEDCQTRYLSTDEEQQDFYDFILSISSDNVAIDENGVVTETD